MVEDIERASRDFYNSVKLERELSDQGIPLFATDEPADITGVNPTTLLIRRVKQGFAEFFRLQLKDKTWKGLKEHTAAGWNLGKVPYGYAPERVTHPNPSKAAQGLTKTRLALDPAAPPIVAQIYTWRTDGKLGIKTITGPAERRPGRLPAPRPGHRVDHRRGRRHAPQPQIHRVPGHRPPPPGQARPRSTNGTGHRHPATPPSWTGPPGTPPRPPAPSTPRPGTATNPYPSARRAYALRSRIRCKICQRRMCGATKTHPARPGQSNTYYVCQYDPANPRHVAAAPDHPRTVSAREDLLLRRAARHPHRLHPGPRPQRTARRTAPRRRRRQEGEDRHQAAALHKRLKQIDTAQDSLIHDLGILPTDPADTAAHAMRARIHAHFTDLHHQRETIEAQLKALASDPGRGNDPDLLDELPELSGRLDELPEHIQAALFAAFDIQVLWNPPMNQATFFATITDTTPGLVTELLTRAGDDPASAVTGPVLTQTPATSSNTASGFTRLPMCGKPTPIK